MFIVQFDFNNDIVNEYKVNYIYPKYSRINNKTSLYTIKRILRAFLVLNLFVIDINIENINNRRNLFNENDYDRSEGLNRFPFLYDGQRASTLLVVRASLVSIFFTEFQRTPSKMKIIKNNWFVDCSN